MELGRGEQRSSGKQGPPATPPAPPATLPPPLRKKLAGMGGGGAAFGAILTHQPDERWKVFDATTPPRASGPKSSRSERSLSPSGGSWESPKAQEPRIQAHSPQSGPCLGRDKCLGRVLGKATPCTGYRQAGP